MCHETLIEESEYDVTYTISQKQKKLIIPITLGGCDLYLELGNLCNVHN